MQKQYTIEATTFGPRFGRLDAQAMRAARAFYSKLFEIAATITEPFGGRMEITILDPKVRSGMTGRDLGIASADFHGV